METFILTSGRPNEQTTLRLLPPAVRDTVWLVVQDREKHLYRHSNLIVLPPEIVTLSPSRQWLLENAAARGIEKILMFDDDLRFQKKDPDDPSKILTCTAEDIPEMFRYISEKLDTYAHVALAPRLFANNTLVDYIENCRAMRVLGYRPKVLMEEDCRFDRVLLRADFDMTLQLLKLGYRNAVVFKYLNDQKGSNTSGGCSAYRDEEAMRTSAEALKKLHPDFVTLVQKTTKGSWGGGTRTDVRINWRRAFASSQES